MKVNNICDDCKCKKCFETVGETCKMLIDGKCMKEQCSDCEEYFS